MIAAAGSAEKLALAEARGADHLIDYGEEDLRARVKEIAADHGKTGADVVFDPVGGACFTAAMRAAAFEGRLVVVGFAAGDIQQIPANILLVKNLDVIGFAWGVYASADPDVLRHSFRTLAEMYEAQQLQPHLGRRLPVEEAGEAYRLLESRTVAGKIVLDIGAADEGGGEGDDDSGDKDGDSAGGGAEA